MTTSFASQRRYGIFVVTLLSLIISIAADVSPGYNVCYGTGSACDLATEGSLQCSNISLTAAKAWYECYCSTGEVGIQQACDNCYNQYTLATIQRTQGAYWSSLCTSVSLPIAPIPASFLSQQAQRNATLIELMTNSLGVITASNKKNVTATDAFTRTMDGLPTRPVPTITGAVQATLAPTAGAVPGGRVAHGNVVAGAVAVAVGGLMWG